MRFRTCLGVGLLAIGLVACGGAGASLPSGSTAQSSDSTSASSQPVTGVCRAFLLGGPIDLGRQVLLLEASGEDPHELTDQMVQALSLIHI